VITVYTVLNELALWIYIVEDNVGVPLMAGCKHDNFEILIHYLQTLLCVRPDIEASLEHLPRLQFYIEINIGLS
jgi:hypothetical protein